MNTIIGFPKPQVAFSIHAGGTLAQHLDWGDGCFLALEDSIAFQPVPLIACFFCSNDRCRNVALVASSSHGFRS